MTFNIPAVFLFNVFLNSLMAFFTVALFIEFFLFILRIKHERVRMLCRAIPLLKLPFDLFRYDFSSWIFSHGINPMHAEKGSRLITMGLGFNPQTLSAPIATHIGFSMSDGCTFTLADWISCWLGPHLLSSAMILIAALSVCIWLQRTCAFFRSRRDLRSILHTASPCQRPIIKKSLQQQVEKYNVTILSSSITDAPFTTGFRKKQIVFPKVLLPNLSQEEFEAIVAHEIEHIRWSDPFVQFALQIICSLFWWIPTTWWKKKLILEQENYCDRHCQSFSVKGLDLALAIQKVIRLTHSTGKALVASITSGNDTLQRIHSLLNPSYKKDRFLTTGVKALSLALLSIALFFGRIWIF